MVNRQAKLKYKKYNIHIQLVIIRVQGIIVYNVCIFCNFLVDPSQFE